ncbi:MAG: universal stress protein [Anaerolineaceae bacterium]|nr:universal stress protein [Anaerolineaceae bacterium]
MLYNTILVPLDGSRRAEAILPHVEKLAQEHGAKVVLMQVVEPGPLLYGAAEGYVEIVLSEARHRMEKAKSYLGEHQDRFAALGVTAEIRLEDGPIVEAIIRVAEAVKADLIAIASHGRTGLARAFYGSVAAGVLQRADRPLLIIRAEDERPAA